ncbi:MAG: FkbM family methyltransferase [Pseudomonadota bacterium]
MEIRGKQLRVAIKLRFDRQFWIRWLPAGWEEDTFDFVDEHVSNGVTFIDIGTWIGPISLCAAALGARVISLEPDPVAHRSLVANVELNRDRLPGSVEVLQHAFNAKPGTVRIFGNHRGFGTSGSSSIGTGWRSISVPSCTPDDLVSMAAGGRSVLKVDIEAHEYFCGAELARLRRELDAPMNLSVHPSALRKSRGWRFWRPRNADAEEIYARTKALLQGFSDCTLHASNAPHSLDGEDLRRRLLPDDGDAAEFTVIATTRESA